MRASARKSAKPRTPAKPWSTFEALTRATSILSRPPSNARIERPERQGKLIARFALPLSLAPAQNRTRGAKPWMLGALKRSVYERMRFQFGAPRDYPLPGRPYVYAVRFSSVEPDKYADWAKLPIDVLCCWTDRAHNRLNLIVDDAPKCAEICQWWEPAKPGEGFVYLEVRSGEV